MLKIYMIRVYKQGTIA